MKLLSPEAVLYSYKSAIRPCMEYYCHVWVRAPSCCFDMLDNIQKWVCRAVGLTIAAYIQSLSRLLSGENVTS